MRCLLFLEFIGTTELLVVLLVALLVFGPRKLPELARALSAARSISFGPPPTISNELGRPRRALTREVEARAAAGGRSAS